MSKNAPVITFFNNKGGVGKTSLVYNLSWMYAQLGKRVLAVDLDPQANFTALCLEDDKLEELWENESSEANETIYHVVSKVIRAEGDIVLPNPISLNNEKTYHLIAGDLRLSQFEDKLSQAWNEVSGGKASGINITSSFGRAIQQTAQNYDIDIVLIDVGPNLGAINRAALIASDYVVVPLVPDLFSLQGLKNLGKFLQEWRADWQEGLADGYRKKQLAEDKAYPKGEMRPIGYVVLQHRERQNRFVASHEKWSNRIPKTYSEHVLLQPTDLTNIREDTNRLGLIRNYQSLMAFAHEARKPVFLLKPADGAIGSHTRIVKEAGATFEELANVIAKRIDLNIETDD